MKDKMAVMLTARDLLVLESLYDNVVMTFGQIVRRHFPGVAKATAINRLTKLETAKVIRRERIPRMTLGLDANAVGVVFQITRDGITELRRRHKLRMFKPEPVRIHPHALHHDLILVDLVDGIKERFGHVLPVSGKLLPGTAEAGLEPDLVVTVPGKGKIAVELELSGKSEKRYRELILRYRLSRDYVQVVYFLEDPFIQRLLTKVILNRPSNDRTPPTTGKFYFGDLHEFIKHPTSAVITNGTECWKNGGLNEYENSQP